jgi:4-amino-4-deoxy-L-arabinose transferase-like glycosyltransferase
MQLSWLENSLHNKRTVWITAAITIFLFLIANLPWQLDDYDQAKQAFTSFQMIKEGRWFYQQTPHEHVATKPPLIGWISAGLFAVTHSWEAGWRLPSFLAAVAMTIFLFRAATSAYGTIAGLIAFSAFGLNLLSPRLATLVRTDMPLALVIFLIGLFIWKKIRQGTEWRLRDRIYLFGLLTVAMLIKGPIVYAFLLPGIGVFGWRRRRHACHSSEVVAGIADPAKDGKSRELDAPHTARRLQGSWSGWWPWLASLAFFLLWVIGGVVFQPRFFNQVVVREFAARFAETIHRPQPLYFYLLHLLHKFAPWSVALIALGIVDLRSRNWRLASAFRAMSPETFWLFCWSLGGLIAMSLIPSKRVDRIFPVVPPLCLLLAAQLPGRVATPRRPYLAIALIFAIVFTGGYTILKVVAGYRDHRDALVVFGRKVRHEAETNHWRYEVVSAKDEGLLLYLRKAHFIEPNQAVDEWNHGDVDALIASTEKVPGLLRELRDAALSQLKTSEPGAEQGKGYALITR